VTDAFSPRRKPYCIFVILVRIVLCFLSDRSQLQHKWTERGRTAVDGKLTAKHTAHATIWRQRRKGHVEYREGDAGDEAGQRECRVIQPRAEC